MFEFVFHFGVLAYTLWGLHKNWKTNDMWWNLLILSLIILWAIYSLVRFYGYLTTTHC